MQKSSASSNKSPKAGKTPKVKQGHKLVWLTAIVIGIPLLIVGYILLTSMDEQNTPVVGSRFTSNDISPAITNTAISEIQNQVSTIPGVEAATTSMKSATLRIHLNCTDDASEDQLKDIVEQAYGMVNAILPIETYFTNTDEGKMYDLEIDAYNYIIDDNHPADGQHYVKLTKTGRGEKIVDVLTKPKDKELVDKLKRENQEEATQEDLEGEQAEEENPEEAVDYGY